MTKLSDKIRIVSSDGEVIREAVKSGGSVEPAKKESGKLSGLLSGKKKEMGAVEKDPSDDNDVKVGDDYEEKASIVDKLTGMFAGKKKGEDDSLAPELPELNADMGNEEVSSDIPADQRKWYIAGVVGLVFLMVVTFVWYISTSQVDAVNVQPEGITEEEVVSILEGDPENFNTIVNSIGSDVHAEGKEDDSIAIDVPEEKEELEARVYELEEHVSELEEENERLVYDKEVLEGENIGLRSRVEEAEKSLAESKEKIEALELGNEKLKKGAGESK